MPDPLRDLFGVPALELFSSKTLVVSHGAFDRFPPFMTRGPMESIDSLSRHYAGPLEVANGSVAEGTQVSVSEAHSSALLRLGLTVYFVDLKRSLPASHAFIAAIEEALGLPECVSLSAFANATGSGLSLHHDRFDQLLFQIRGKKLFRYGPNHHVDHPDVPFSPFTAAAPDFGHVYRKGFPLTSDDVIERDFTTVTLEPGSALFMPAGTWHSTADQPGESLSIVVVVRAPTRLAVVSNLLRHYAGQSANWRTPVYAGWADGAEAAREQAALRDLITDLGRRLSAHAGALAESAPSAWSIDGYATGALSKYPVATRFTRFVRLPNSTLAFEDDPTPGKLRCVVKSGPMHRPQARTVLALNVEARQIVEWILGVSHAFTVDDLYGQFADFARDEIESLLGWLAQAALVRPLAAPEWDDG